MNKNIDLNDGIDLKDLFLLLWRGKLFIVLAVFVCIFFASLHLRSEERKYTVEYNLKPVSEIKTSPQISGFGGLASIAGLQLPTRTNNDFNIYIELLTSTEVSEIIFKKNKKIIREIFRSEWNMELNDFSTPLKSKNQILINKLKRRLTGNKELNYMPPNPKRLAMFIDDSIKINQEKETGFLTLTSETSKPTLMLSLMIEATDASDKIMRQRYVDFSTEPLSFYKEKLRTARSREHREALAELISQEEEKLMFASVGKYFIAEPYIKPKISLYPTLPKSKLILSLSLILGLFLGVALTLIWHSIKKEN